MVLFVVVGFGAGLVHDAVRVLGRRVQRVQAQRFGAGRVDDVVLGA
ncbi:hypothetical protein LP419_29460 [Massilia sp. H-1]|nr:hypothetical protein LP419_29460 [Massilia sp. H-1]